MNGYSSQARNIERERIIRNNRRRRNLELRRNFILMILTVVVFIAFAIMFFSTKSVASSTSDTVYYKHYKSIQISSGDTLYDLSLKFVNAECNDSASFISEVRYINNMDEDDLLYTGSYIVIPYYDTING